MFLNKQIKHKAGFTLAEVLVTLAIIGVVAALTIPSLMTNINEKQYKTAWKKSFSTFSQATKQLFIEEEKDNFIDVFTSGAVMQAKYEKYYNVINSYPAWGGWHSNNTWYNLDGTPINQTRSSVTYLADGTMMSFFLAIQGCTDSRGAMNDICGEVYFDVNGKKKPNTVGKDIFIVFVRSKMITPRGSDLDDGWVQASCTPAGLGWGCAAKYLLE